MGCGSSKVGRVPPPPPTSFPEYVSSPVEELHREFIKSTYLFILNDDIFQQKRRNRPAISFKSPEELSKLLDHGLHEEGTDPVTMLDILLKIVHYSPTFAHPYYMFQLLAGLDPYSIIGDFVTAFIPATMLSYRAAPVYVLMEEEISKKLCQLAGYPQGTGDCIFPPGAAIANVLGFVLGRDYLYPEIKEQGMMHLKPLAMFVSRDTHSCANKGAIFTSIGLDNVYYIDTEDNGRMSMAHLEKCIQDAEKAGKIPFMVGATAGTNPLGAYDPLVEISKLCKKNKMWLHADGAFGGGLIFSPTHRAKQLKGLELCDSFSGNFHKLGSATQVSSYLITPHTTLLAETFGTSKYGDYTSITGESDADYFHSQEDVYPKYVDHARRPDIVKLFMMLKGKGIQGMAANMEDAYKLTRFFLNELKQRKKETGNFIPVMDDFESPLVAFYYVPKYLLDMDKSKPEYKEQLNIHTSFMLAELINTGIMVVTVQNVRQSPLFFKFVLHNSSVTSQDLMYILDQLDNYGRNIRVPMI